MIWSTLFNPSLNLVYSLSELQNGATYRDCDCRLVPAGKGLTIALVVQALGEEVGITGLLPEYERKRFTTMLDANGICHFLFSVPGDIPVNTTLHERENGASTRFAAAPSVIPGRLQHEFTEYTAKHMTAGDYWCFSGPLPRGFADDGFNNLLDVCAERGGQSLLDTNGIPLQKGVRSRPAVVKPNLNELEGFFGEQIRGVHHIALKGKRLLDMGIAYIFISLGADGMIALHKNDCILCSAPTVEVKETSGCGDALVAGILVARKRQFSFTETCRMAVACGSARAACGGPGIIRPDMVWQLMEDVRITSV